MYIDIDDKPMVYVINPWDMYIDIDIDDKSMVYVI
jgi:hypothetical protein